MSKEQRTTKCSNKHVEISFAADRCPLCLLRDEALLELAQPRANYEMFGLSFTSHVLHDWPFVHC